MTHDTSQRQARAPGPASVALAILLLATTCLGQSRRALIAVETLDGATNRGATPVAVAVDLAQMLGAAIKPDQLRLSEQGAGAGQGGEPIPAQFEAGRSGALQGKLHWLIPPGPAGRRTFVLEEGATPAEAVMQVRKDPATGRWDMSEAGKRILSYNYQTNEPGEILSRVSPNNLKYARPRSDYIHPLYGPAGEELTKDWSVDHPHHRGIYWAWPEVDYAGQRGDLHALQRVFARPTGQCLGRGGVVMAQIEAENLWRWEDQEPIVRERVIIRAWRASAAGRYVDLEFEFTALKDEVTIARRDTRLYGGLNIRLAPVKDQHINFFTDPPAKSPRMAWAELSGMFAGGKEPVGLAVFQSPTNPNYPGDWVKYPEINWFQPTFPAAGTRYALKKGQPLVLQFRLWIHPGSASEAEMAGSWSAYAHPPRVTFPEFKNNQ
jgi:hypothetical protein